MLARLLIGIELSFVLTSLAGLAVGAWGACVLSRRARRPSAWAQDLYETLTRDLEAASDGRRSWPELRVSDRLGMPVLLGGLRPTILIPEILDAQGPGPSAADALRLSLLHELAHQERADLWFSLAGRLAWAFWFFLPPLWWIRAQMRLDHEFLADRRAASEFDEPLDYASSLLGLAASPEAPIARPGPEMVASLTTGTPVPSSPGKPAASPLFQRILMLVRCPFDVELDPPAWWRWSVALVLLAITPALACVEMDLNAMADLRPTSPLAQARGSSPSGSSAPVRTFSIARLTVGPFTADAKGLVPAVELPLSLPDQFDLTLEVWGNHALLGQCRVLGQRLALPNALANDPFLAGMVEFESELGLEFEVEPGRELESEPEPETWHRVMLQVRRRPLHLALAVDGQPLPADPGIFGLPHRLTIEPPPDRPSRVRNLCIRWLPPHAS